MKKWIKISITVSLAGGIVLILFAVWGYVRFNPEHHFAQTVHPVLAKPSSQPLAYTTHAIPEQVIEESYSSAEQSSFNVLLLGIDARAKESSRTDIMIVAHIDPTNHTVNLVSIPRDTRVHLPGVGYTKINHAHFLGQESGGNKAGTEASIQAVSNLLGIPINYYFKMNFEGFIHFIDTIGGVEVDLPNEIRLEKPLQGRDIITLPAGKQTLDGHLTLDFVRERYSLSNGDFGRQSSQIMVLKLVAEKLTQMSYIPKLPKLFAQVEQDVIDTNFDNSDLISLAWLYSRVEDDQVQYSQLPGHSEYMLDPLVGSKLYYWVPSKEGIEHITQFLQD